MTHEDKQSVMDEIVAAIEATDVARAEEYDLDAIFDETYEWVPDLRRFVSIADPEEFWASVERHEK